MLAHKQDISIWVFLVVMVSLPFFFVRFVPSSDLPQHLAQVRLFNDVLSGNADRVYSIEWSGANALAYVFLDLNWKVFEPIASGKAMMIELVLAWVISTIVLARRLGRPTESALLGSILVFNASFYWGFINFLIGWPVFVAWYLAVVNKKEIQSPVRQVVYIFGLGVLLFAAHALWLAVGLLVLLVADIRHRISIRYLLLQAGSLLPLGIYSLLWYNDLSSKRELLSFDTAAHWTTMPWERLGPG